MTVPDCTPPEDCLLLACDVAVRRALEVASKRMWTRQPRWKFAELPRYLVYTRFPVVTDDHALDRLLVGAWSSLPEQLCDVDGLVPALEGYVRSLLSGGEAHDPDYLRPVIRRAVL